MSDEIEDIVWQLQENAAHLSWKDGMEPYSALLDDAAKEIQQLRRQVTIVSESREIDEDLVLWSLEYVAELLGLSERKVRNMVQAGDIPHINAGNGRYKRIRQSDFREYLEGKYNYGDG
ncbi:MAG: helix-turn-helix domain-containing protein [Rhodothermales bacterium]|nr:helix-turn-helix domain-containing protein [Rhodothermales bacterium]